MDHSHHVRPLVLKYFQQHDIWRAKSSRLGDCALRVSSLHLSNGRSLISAKSSACGRDDTDASPASYQRRGPHQHLVAH